MSPSGPTLVSLSAVTWDFALVGRTRMLCEAWTRASQPNAFVSAPSLRTGLQRAARAALLRSDDGVIRPWPAAPARAWRRIGEARLLRIVRRRAQGLRRMLARRVSFRDAVALVVTPAWTPWLDELPFARVIYDCIDDPQVHVPRPGLLPLIERWERDLIARADGAVASADTLVTAIQRRRTDLPTRLIRNGVRADWFAERARSTPRPADLPAGDRPIIGFVGALYGWIDFDLIAAAAARMSEADFVFVGPLDLRARAHPLRGRPNVRLLGRRPYEHVPAYMKAFDVCWAPFAAGPVAQATDPVKIYEYLALGKPVVSTPIGNMDCFEGLIRFGRGADEIVAALNAALSEPHADADRRIAYAAANSWDTRARDYTAFATELAQSGRAATVTEGQSEPRP